MCDPCAKYDEETSRTTPAGQIPASCKDANPRSSIGRRSQGLRQSSASRRGSGSMRKSANPDDSRRQTSSFDASRVTNSMDSKSSPLNVSVRSDSFSQNQGSVQGEESIPCPDCSQKSFSSSQLNANGGSVSEKPSSPRNSRNSMSRKCCTFKLPGSFADASSNNGKSRGSSTKSQCNMPVCNGGSQSRKSVDSRKSMDEDPLDKECVEAASGMNQDASDNLCCQEDPICCIAKAPSFTLRPVYARDLANVYQQNPTQDERASAQGQSLLDEDEESDMRGQFKMLKFHKKPTNVTNLREKIQQYVKNRPDQVHPAPNKLTPFSDPIETKCFYPIDEELEAQFRAEQEAAQRDMENRKLEAEVQCYKNVIPPTLPWKTQEKYLDCMGATEEGKQQFQEYMEAEKARRCFMEQAEALRKRMPSDWTCEQQMSYLDCMGICDEVKQFLLCSDADPCENDQIGRESTSSQKRNSVQNSQQNRRSSASSSKREPDISDMIENCKKEFRASGLDVSSPPKLSNAQRASQQSGRRCNQSINNSQGSMQSFQRSSMGALQQETGSALQQELEDEEEPPDTESDLNHPMFGKKEEEPEPTLADEMKRYRAHLASLRSRYFGTFCKEMENAESITPDVAAAMVYSGDLGISLKAAPERVYDFLYPDAPGNQTISIADVIGNLPKGIDDIVVPIVPPIVLESRNAPDMEDPAMLDSPRVVQVGPALNLVDEVEVKDLTDPIDIKELVTGQTSVNYLELMFPETADMVLEEEDEEDEERRLEKAREEMFNIKLVESLPLHYSQVQMRGSIPPNWFPGFWSASPTIEGIRKSTNAAEVMEKMWEEMQPERVRPAGAAYIIGN